MQAKDSFISRRRDGMRRKLVKIGKKCVALALAFAMVIQPAVGAVGTVVTAQADDVTPVFSIKPYENGSTTIITKEEGAAYSFTLPEINTEKLTADNYAIFENSCEMLINRDGEWRPIDEVLTRVTGSEEDLTANSYLTTLWVDGEWSGWGMSVKVDGTLNSIRIRSKSDPEHVYLDYKLQCISTVRKMEFIDHNGKDSIEIGRGEAIAVNFDYISINDGEILGGEYGQANFEWFVVAGGAEKPLNEVYTWDKNWGWDIAPANAGYWFNPILESFVLRAKLKDTALYADYTVTVLPNTPKGPEYDPSKGETSEDVKDPGTSKSGYKLVWSDEFDGSGDNVDSNTGLNLDKWSYQLGNGKTAAGLEGWGNSERQSYTDRSKNISVENGLLRITAAYEADGYSYGNEGKSYYTSARIVTKGTEQTGPLFNTTYGYVEARMALPATAGAWPAFWMLPQSTDIYGAWPVSGEIDIMETCGNKLDTACATLHYGAPDHVYQGSGYQELSSGMEHFHTYAVNWEPGKITFLYDGNAVYTQANWESKIPNSSESLAFDAPFDQPYYILLNLAVDSGVFGGAGNKALFQDDINMYVDYVRVYHKEGGYDATGVKRAQAAGNLDWGTLAGTSQIAEISSSNVMAADGGNVNAIETAGTIDRSKWYLAYTEGGAATVEAASSDGTDWAKVSVSAAGSQPHSVQLIGHYDAKKGYVYKVSFDAWAEGGLVGKTASVDSKEWKGWSTYGITSFTLEENPTSYSFLIDQLFDFDDARIEVNLGTLGAGTAYVGNMRVEVVDPETLGEDPKRDSKPFVAGKDEDGGIVYEYLYNGTFDQGMNRAGYWSALDGTSFSVPAYTDVKLADEVGVKDIAADVDNGGVMKYFARRANIRAEGADTEPGIYQSGFALPADEYALTFDLYSEDSTTVTAAICSVDSTGKPGTRLMESDKLRVTGSTQMKKYSWSFRTLRDLRNAAIVLSFDKNASVQVDNVSLKLKSKASITGTANMDRDMNDYKTITYNMNDQDGSVDSGKAVNADANPFYYVQGEGTIRLEAPTWKGHTFTGWSIKREPESQGDLVTEISTDRTSITLYAQWDREDLKPSEPTVPTITAQPAPLSNYKIGDAAVPLQVTANAGSDNLTYQWYKSENADMSDRVEIPGATKAACTPDTSAAGTLYYQCVVTNTNGEATVSSEIAKVQVTASNPTAPAITAQPAQLTNYKTGDTAVPLQITANAGDAALTYQWYKSEKADMSGRVEIPGATKAAYTPDISAVGTIYYQCVVTNANGGATATSVVAEVRVTGVDVSAPQISVQPVATSSYTYGQTAAALSVQVLAVTDGTLSYQWYMSSSAGAAGTAINGATAASYIPNTEVVGTAYYYCIVTNRSTSATGTAEKQTKSGIAAVSVAKAAGGISVASKFNKVYGKKFNLGAKGYGTLTYTSSKPSIAAVDKAGNVTTKNTGKATITITASGDANHTGATVKVQVNIAPKKVTGLKVKSSAAGKVVVRFKKNTKATGYQIQYSTSSKFKKAKTVTITKNKSKKPTITISKLKAGKKYYIRVRAYKNKAKSQRVYSAWTAKKKVTIKK